MKSRRLTDNRVPLSQRWIHSFFAPMTAIVIVMLGAFALFVWLSEKLAISSLLWAIAAAAVLVLVMWLLGRRYMKHITAPLELLNGSAEHIAEGSYGIRTEKLCDDELGDLTDKLNEISERIVTEGTVQSEFISSVSHELRTPLTAVTGWAEALGYDEAIQGDSRRGLEIITRETARLTKMVSELLEFTRIQDGRFYLNFELVDIVAEVEDAAMAYSKLMQQEKLELCLNCAENIPPIEGDSERLKQVILNLLDNAAKYGKDGEKVEVSVFSDGKNVTITVRDHGCGILEDELPRIKERFYKGSGKERGSGIGLAVCEEIVTRHGGTLTIENAEGGGVLATVLLPENNRSMRKENV